ncbi:VWA domain-containing protein [Selenomonas sputigena]|uniref:VWA domain-containing protein n=1 Tax=Selenomonas sputigena TaxID=69823 RepID=A0ABV3X4G2_9FIRM
MTEEKKAKQGKTELVFILDRSGSMSGLESDTIGGFNGMLRRQQEESADVLVSTVLFDDGVEIVHDRVPIGKVPQLTEKEYFTRGCTALLDAVGGSIHHIRNIHKYAREEDRPVRTMFVITTDGLENSSVRYTAKKVKKLIEHQEKKHGWEFIFLGANMDAVAVAGDLGIRRENSVEFACDRGGVRTNFVALGALADNFVKTGAVTPGWNLEIAEYCAKAQEKK